MNLKLNWIPYYPKDRKEWREWLQDNHNRKQSIWFLYYKARSTISTVSHSDAVDEALCFGWIDSRIRSLDEKMTLYFGFKKIKSRIPRLTVSDPC